MPTPTGLPKVGEVWERRLRLPDDDGEWKETRFRVIVLERGGGEYWSLRVANHAGERTLWVDPAYWFSKGELVYVGKAGPETRKRFGLA